MVLLLRRLQYGGVGVDETTHVTFYSLLLARAFSRKLTEQINDQFTSAASALVVVAGSIFARCRRRRCGSAGFLFYLLLA